MPRGWCWWVMHSYITKGQWPTIQIGNLRIPWTPGMGWGWLMWYLTQQQPQTTTQSYTNEIENLKKLKEELERQLEEIKKRLEELEKK